MPGDSLKSNIKQTTTTAGYDNQADAGVVSDFVTNYTRTQSDDNNTEKAVASRIDSYFQQQTTGLLSPGSCCSVSADLAWTGSGHTQPDSPPPMSYPNDKLETCAGAASAVPMCCPPSYTLRRFTPPGPYEALPPSYLQSLPVSSSSSSSHDREWRACNAMASSCCSRKAKASSSATVEYIYDLPYSVRKSICDLLDADNSWRELGGNYLQLDSTQLTLFSHALYRNASPTNSLLTKWEASNAKVWQLYYFLACMRHYRALKHLQPYVSSTPIKCEDDSSNELVMRMMRMNASKHDSDQEPLFQMEGSICQQNASPVTPKQVDVGNSQAYFDTDLALSSLTACKNVCSARRSPSSSLPQPNAPPVDFEHHSHEHHSHEHHSHEHRSHEHHSSDTKVNTAIQLQPKQVSAAGVKTNYDPEDSTRKTLNAPKDSLSQFKDLEIRYAELASASNHFSSQNILGSGGFGTVFLGEWKGTKVAIKKLKGIDNVSQALTELRILNCCRIDNILPLYGVSLDGPEPCLVYQYMANGSLEDRLLCKGNSQALTWLQRASIAEGVARALHFLHTFKHNNPYVHGDVKSANILLNAILQPKLGDFGLARQMMKHHHSDTARRKTMLQTHCTVSSVNGTSVYLPSEYLRNKILSPAVDVYSYGIVVLEMATGRRAYDGKKLLINTVEDEYSRIQKLAQQLNARASSCEMLETSLDTLMDKRIAFMAKHRRWFTCLLELGRNSANKIKSKRPTMKQVLEYFNQCKTTDKIYRLCTQAIQANKPCFSKSNLKSPSELQLWYDFVRKECGTLSEAVFDNFGAQVTKLIEDLKSKNASDCESTYHLDMLLNSFHQQQQLSSAGPTIVAPTSVAPTTVEPTIIITTPSCPKSPNLSALLSSSLADQIESLLDDGFHFDDGQLSLQFGRPKPEKSGASAQEAQQDQTPPAEDSTPFIPLLTALGFNQDQLEELEDEK